jgi:hypothetical protein
MNPLHHALAILGQAELAVDAEYTTARIAALKQVDEEYGLRLARLQNAKKAISKRLDSVSNLGAEIYWHLHDSKNHDIQRETNNKIRRSLRRERSAKELKR